MNRFGVKARGVTAIRGYPNNLIGLMRRQDEGWAQRLILVADDDNPVDDMAVLVVLDRDSLRAPTRAGLAPIGHDFLEDYTLGWLPAPVAARIRPELDDWSIDQWEVLVVPSRPTNPGLDVTCVRRSANAARR